jgi:hypothetical protein
LTRFQLSLLLNYTFNQSWRFSRMKVKGIISLKDLEFHESKKKGYLRDKWISAIIEP